MTVERVQADDDLPGPRDGADTILPAIGQLKRRWSGPVTAYPDSGYVKMPHRQFVDIMPADELAAFGRRWTAAGVQVVGRCCGLGVEHVRALARSCGTAD